MPHNPSDYVPHQVHQSKTSSEVPRGAPAHTSSACDADIAKRAYAKYEARGRVHGFDREDWIAAGDELIAERLGHLTPSARPDLSAVHDGQQFRKK
jgi:hypothetical protein